MLGDMQAIDAGRVGGFGELQPLVEQRRQRPFAILDVIEKSDFHGASSLCIPACGIGVAYLAFCARHRLSPILPAHAGAILVGLQSRGMDAVDRQLLVAILGIAGDADRADDFAVIVADQHAAAFGKNLLAARRNQIAHEDRPLLGALVHQLGAAPQATAPHRLCRRPFRNGSWRRRLPS